MVTFIAICIVSWQKIEGRSGCVELWNVTFSANQAINQRRAWPNTLAYYFNFSSGFSMLIRCDSG